MLAEFVRAANEARAAAAHVLFSARYSRPILLAILLAMFNQLSGINAILYYLNDIFAAAGFDKMSSDLQAIAIGAANLIATMIALRVIDKFGRKKLLLIGAVGTAVAQAGVALIMGSGQGNEYLLAMLIMFIAFFAFSQGAVIWVYLAEIFPTAVRARGQALGSTTHWLMNALIATVFPMIAAKAHGVAVRILRRLHGGAVLRRARGVSGNSRRGAGVDGQGNRKEIRSRRMSQVSRRSLIAGSSGGGACIARDGTRRRAMR